jgi:Icc-related predicted phosphoesterase
MVRIVSIADIHFRATGESPKPLLARAADVADVLVLCGDLTDYGLPEEAARLARASTALRIPIVAVLGNHDYQSGREGEVRQILLGAGVHVLDGDTCEVCGVGFGGVKGFCGGFGRHTLEPWGEPIMKQFVQETVDEMVKLGSALARLHTAHRIAVLHYAPIQGTVEGEPVEIYPFLGSSRLEEPLNRYGVTAVYHGHAHHGQPEGRTQVGIPVYNVSLPLLRRLRPDRPFHVLELPVEPESAPQRPAP